MLIKYSLGNLGFSNNHIKLFKPVFAMKTNIILSVISLFFLLSCDDDEDIKETRIGGGYPYPKVEISKATFDVQPDTIVFRMSNKSWWINRVCGLSENDTVVFTDWTGQGTSGFQHVDHSWFKMRREEQKLYVTVSENTGKERMVVLDFSTAISSHFIELPQKGVIPSSGE